MASAPCRRSRASRTSGAPHSRAHGGQAAPSRPPSAASGPRQQDGASCTGLPRQQGGASSTGLRAWCSWLVLLAALALPSPSLSASLCLQPIAGGAEGQAPTAFTGLVLDPQSPSSVLISDYNGHVYTAISTSSGQLENWQMFLNLTDRVAAGPGLGVRGMAFHPDFLDTGRLFISYVCDTTKWPLCNQTLHNGGPPPLCPCPADPDASNATSLCPMNAPGCTNVLVVDEFYVPVGLLPDSGIVSRMMAVGVPSSTNVGGSLSFHAGSTNLLIALGDGGAPNAAQNLSLPLGKILRVDVDTLPPSLEQVQRQGLMGEYAVPDGNLGRLGVPGATFAVGFRDPRGCAEVPLLSGRLVCSDIGRAPGDQVYTVQGSANYGWPQCPAKWGFPPSPDDCADPVANFSAAPNPSPTIGGGYLVQGGPDSCLANWYLYNNGSNSFYAVKQNTSSYYNFSLTGPMEVLNVACYPGPDAPCSAPGGFVSWATNGTTAAYVVGDIGIYRMVNPSYCSQPCTATEVAPPATGGGTGTGGGAGLEPPGSPAAPGGSGGYPSGTPEGSPSGGDSYPGTPAGGGDSYPGTPAGGGDSYPGTPASGGDSGTGSPPSPTSSSNDTSSTSSDSSAASSQDVNSFLSASGINGSFDTNYWIKWGIIMGLMVCFYCGICAFFIITGWRDGKKKDQRFLELKQAENDLDDRSREHDDTLVYVPAGDPDDEEEGLLDEDEDGTEQYSEDEESLSQYSSGYGPESASGYSASTGDKGYGGGGGGAGGYAGSEAGTDYTGYSGHTGQTAYSGQTQETGYGGGDRDDFTDAASGYSRPQG